MASTLTLHSSMLRPLQILWALPSTDRRGGQQEACNCSYGKRHAGYHYYNSFINSVFCILTTVNLLVPDPVSNVTTSLTGNTTLLSKSPPSPTWITAIASWPLYFWVCPPANRCPYRGQEGPQSEVRPWHPSAPHLTPCGVLQGPGDLALH